MTYKLRLEQYIDALSRKLSIQDFSALMPEKTDRVPQVGDIWLLRRDDQQTLVMITFHDLDVTRGVLLEHELAMASQEDVFIPPEYNSLKKPLIAALWWDEPFTREDCSVFLGRVEQPTQRVVLMLLQNSLTGGYRVRATARVDCEGLPFLQWSIASMDNPEDVFSYTTGRMLISPNDLRFKAREVLRSAHQWVEEPLQISLGVRSLVNKWIAACTDVIDFMNSQIGCTTRQAGVLRTEADVFRGETGSVAKLPEEVLVMNIFVGDAQVLLKICFRDENFIISAQDISFVQRDSSYVEVRVEYGEQRVSEILDEEGYIPIEPLVEEEKPLNIQIQYVESIWSQKIE